MPGRPTNLGNSRARAYCVCSRCGWGFRHFYSIYHFSSFFGGGALVLGKLLVPGRPTIWISVGQGPTVPAVGAGGGCLNIFTLIYPFSPLSSYLWETARYRLKYCLKRLLNPKQPTNQHLLFPSLWEMARYRLKYCLEGPLGPKGPTNQSSSAGTSYNSEG